MKKKDRIFSEVYKVDESTNVCMIEIALERYSEIFNKWDSAPFKRREVNLELEEYLKRCSDEIPFRYSIELNIAIPQGNKNQQREDESRNGIKNHFNFKIYLLKEKLNKNNRRTLYCALAGFFLLGGVLIWQSFPNSIFPSILEQVRTIGGWFFLWEAFSLFFFSNYELYHSYRT
ncbi:MAG: hypothetical protein AB4038_01730, partial [Prochloraceae cyanobacterium]